MSNLESCKQNILDLFKELIVEVKSKTVRAKLRKYARNLLNLSNLELRLAITIHLYPYYIGNNIERYVLEEIVGIAGANLEAGRIVQITQLLEKLCESL